MEVKIKIILRKFGYCFVFVLYLKYKLRKRIKYYYFTTLKITNMKETIKELITTYFEKLKAADAESISLLYSEDGVMMPPIFPTVSGKEAVKKFYEMALGKKRFNMSSEIVEIIEDTNIAVVRTLSKGTSETIETKETSNEDSKELFVLKKASDEWKIARLILN